LHFKKEKGLDNETGELIQMGFSNWNGLDL